MYNPTLAEKYVKSIRNADKREYAQQYLTWIRAGVECDPPKAPESLSYMAAQAVRLRLHSM